MPRQVCVRERVCAYICELQENGFYFYTVISENNAYNDCLTPCTD